MNKVHKIIWSAALNTWVVASELAKGKQKASTTQCVSAAINNSHNAKRNILWATLIMLGLASSTGAYAATCTAGTAADLTTRLNDTSCDRIELTADITWNYTNLIFGAGRDSITIDGKGFTLNTGGVGTRIVIQGIQTNSTGGNLSLNFVNFKAITSNNDESNPVVWVTNNSSKVDVTFDQINAMPKNMYSALANNIGAGNTQNPYSQLIIGNIIDPISMKLDTNRQIAQASKIKFTGNYKLVTTGGGNSAYSYVFWSDSAVSQNKIEVASTADVEIKLAAGDRFTTGDSNGKGYTYTFADGAKFLLWSQQNVFGVNTGINAGVQIGTYDKTTGTWGTGAQIQIAGVGGAQLLGDGLTNNGGNAQGIDNGATGAADVVFNLAAGSKFNTSGKGISVVKNNASGIYVRSATDITAATGIQIEHNGIGAVVLANEGIIASTTAGIQLLSTSNNTMALDSTGGVINASSGVGIKVGTAGANGNLNLNLTGGEINLAGSATGIEFNGTSTNTHTITGTTINVNGATGTAIKSNSANNAITLKNTKVNVIDGTGFSSLSGITFAEGGSGERNAVTVTGAGTGVKVAKDLSELSNAYLDINVTSSTGTGIEITSGTLADQIIVGDNLNINASGATAIKISGTGARDFINNGTVQGSIVFANGAVNNTITNNKIIEGTLTTGDGNDTLILAAGSQANGEINLGNGINTVTINDGAKVASIVTGAGNDTFNLITATSSTDLGVIDAGTGVNELNLISSKITLIAATELKNFQTVSLKSASDLVLVNTINIASGTIDIATDSQLSFAAIYNGMLTAALSGAGTAQVQDSANVTLNKASAFAGTWDVNQGGALTATNADQLGTSALKVAGTLNLNNVASLNNTLTGVGLVNVDTANNPFSFGSGVGNAFAGTVDLKNSTFNLSGDNTAALTSATLKVSTGNVTTVANTNQTIGNLDLNGGTTVFVDGSLITTSNLSVSDNSTIKVDATSLSSSGNLLDQDNNTGALTQLVSSGNTLTAGDLAKLTLQNATGGALGGGAISNVEQGGITVAIATHNHSLLGEGGLSVGSLLTELNLQDGKTLTLTSSGATDAALTAKLTGVGNLLIGTDNVSTTINNDQNDYTGATNVDGGILTLGSDNALGATSYLSVNDGATTNINGKTQTVGAVSNMGTVIVGASGIFTTTKGSMFGNYGTINLAGGSLISQSETFTNGGSIDLASGTLTVEKLNNHSGATIDLAGGVLNLTGGSSYSYGDEGLTGAGTLNVKGGDFMINATNSGLSAATNIASSASVSLSGTGALGTSAVNITGNLNLYVADTLANILSGTGNVNINAAVTLTGTNTGFTGTQAIQAGGELTVGSAANLGDTTATANLEDASSKLIFNAVSEAVANVLAGVADSIVEITNSANMDLSGDNSNFAGKYDITGNSILTVSEDSNLGTSDVAINSGSQLVLSSLEGGALTALDNTLTGTGTLALSGSNLNIVDTKVAAFTGTFNIKDSSALNVSSDTQLSNDATINVATTSDQFNIASSGVFNLNNKLIGNGLVNVDTTNTAFSFGTNAGNAFAGTVDLQNSTFDLSGDNTTALTNATLKVSTGNSTTVGIKGTASTENINALDINGGTLIFNGGVPSTKAESTIAVNNLALTGGKVEVNGDAASWTNPAPSGSLSILDQNRGDIKLELISSANAVSGSTDDIDLYINGDKISPGTPASYSDILQGSTKVAIGSYNYDLVSANQSSNGLYVNYSLTELNLLVNGADALLIATDSSAASNKNLTAKLIGVGGLVVDASLNDLTISNANNTYTGTTTVNAGTLILGSNKALGQTSLLDVKANAITNINGNTQTVGALTNAGSVGLAGGTLTSQGALTNTGIIGLAGGALTAQGALTNTGTIDLTNGTLNLSAGGTSSSVNGLTGAGTLNVNGGDFVISAANNLSAATNIANGAHVSLNSAGALGTSAVSILGDLNLNTADTLANILSGTGNVNTSAAVTLTGTNTGFTGTQAIKAGGTLTVGSAANLGDTSAKVNLVDASSKLIFNAVSEAVANVLTGVADSIVQITNSANMGLSGDNSNFTGKYDITGNSILTVSKNNNLGTSDVAIGSGSQLVLSALEGGALTALDNTLTGTGTLALSGSRLNIIDTKANGFTGTFNIKDSSALNVSSDTQLNTGAAVNVATINDQFNITSTSAFNLNNKLTGAGLVNVNTNNTAFSFGSGVGNTFAGTVDLQNSTFDLSGNNTTALTSATLKLSSGNITTVGIENAPSTQSINALDINGGTLIFNGGVPSAKAESTIAVNNLALTGGKVEVNGNTSGWTNENPVIGGNLSILEQNRGDIKLELISSVNTVTGGAGSIDLHINGVQISSNTQASYLDILQGGNKVATGTYNYGLVSTNGKADNGLYVNYGLTELNLLANDADALLIATDANSASNKDLSVKLTGVGGLVVEASQNNLTISNGNNDYTGTTTINAGTLVLGSNGALGQTSLLDVKSGATANINGKTQTVGALTNSGSVNLGSATGSLTSTNTLVNYGAIGLAGGTLTSQRLDNNTNGTIDLAGGTLTLQTLYNNGTIDLAAGVLDLSAGGSSQLNNGLTGAGTLNIKGGDFMINGTNSGLSATTNIASGASVSLGGTGALGTSAVAITGDLNLYVADTLANTLSGTGNVNTNAAVTLTGTNTGFTGTQAIKADGTLTVGSATNIGATTATVNLETVTSKLIFDAVSDTIANVLTGVADSIVEITNSANMSLTGDNSGFAGKYDINGNGSILTVTKDNNLGTSDVAIGSDSQLVLNGFEGGLLTALDNTLTGTGTLALSGSKLNIIDTKAAAFTGTFNIKDSSALNVSSDTQLSNDATINVATTSDQFNIASSGAFNLNNKLTGQGLVNVDTTNSTFSFGTNAGNAFAGTVDLKNSTFDLSGNNTTVLTNATLKVSTGNSTTVGLGEQNIGGLVINGGTLYFNDITETAGVITSGGTIKANTIDATGTGNIRVDLPSSMTPGLEGFTVMTLDEGAVVVDLAKGAATGSGSLLTLTDKNGAPIGVDITQGLKNTGSDTDSAMGTFNYGLTTGNSKDGLYVNYGLNQVELLGVGADALKLTTTVAQAGTAASDLSAKVTGAGDLAIEADIGTTASLSNTTNNYTGATFVRSGSLRLDADSALGQTTLLNMSTDTKVDINATTQTVGELQSALGSTLDLNGGHLTIKSGGLVEGALIGAGDLIVNANTLTINGANASLTAQVRIDAPATIGLNNVAGLGSSDITLAGVLALDNASGDLGNSITGAGDLTLNNASNVNLTRDSSDFAGQIAIDDTSSLTATAVAQLGTASITNDGTFTFNLNTQDEALKNTVVGSGDLIKDGTKRLSLTQSLGYTGTTSINEGSLFVGDNLTLGGVGAGDVTIAAGADLSGSGFVNGHVINYGSINVNNDPTRRAFDSATLTINNSLDNHNTINISNSSGTVGNSLVVNGDYTGFGNAALYMNTALGNDTTSIVDQFIITGHAGGSTSVYVNNVGGIGASTSEIGVRLIDVGTSDTTAFSLANTVVSGAYEYLLNRNDANQDWYLSSYVAPDPIIPPVQLYRPDSGNHIANMESAVKSQVPGLGGQSGIMAGGSGGMRAMNRLGNNWANQETTENQKLYSIWNVTTGSDSKGRAANGQIRYSYDSVGTLLGGDRSIFVGRSLIQLGAMVGTSKSDSSSRNLITGSRGTGEVDGTTFGLYGTWYLDSNSALSPFIDAFITYGRYKNEVKTWGNTPTKYNSKALSITLQGGYPIALTSNVVLEPQAQITYLDYSAKDHYDHSGTRVTQDLSGNVIGRVGAYVYLTDMPVKPYAALNLWYDNTSSTVKYNGHKVSSDKAGFMLEAKVGLEAQLSPNFSISGGVNYRQGNHSSKNYSGNIGFKYTF